MAYHKDANLQTSFLENCIKKMSHCCEFEMPFHASSLMLSTIDAAEECIGQIKRCYELETGLLKLKEYERTQDITKIMLILSAYGSKDEFQNAIENARAELDKSLDKFRSYLKELTWLRESKSYSCSRCGGTGILSRLEYQREQGVVSSVVRTYKCDECKGKGKISLGNKTIESLKIFLDTAQKLLYFLEDCEKTKTRDANITSFF